MAHGNQYNSFSAADIEKYWKGELPAPAMHAMEKAALEDPFLADALEGYKWRAQNTEASINADADELRQRLRERSGEGKVITMPGNRNSWWKIAASVVVLIGAAALAFQFLNNRETNEVAVVTPSESQKQNPALADTLKKMDSASVVSDSVFVDNFAAVKHDKKPLLDISAAKTNLATVDTTSLSGAANDIVKNNTPPAPVATDAYREKEAKEVAAEKDIAIQKPEFGAIKKSQKNDDAFEKKRSAQNNAAAGQVNLFSGRVIDQNNQPVPGAIVRLPLQRQTVATDANGLFNFSVPDTMVTASIASVGYETQNISLRNGNYDFDKKSRARDNDILANQVQLKPQTNTLDEVVVSGYGTQKRKNAPAVSQSIDVNVLQAAPLISWDEYNQYLEKNKVLVDEVKSIHGTVMVSFTVTKKGLSDFKIEQSLNDYLDAEAIRLVKEGPRWKLLKGKKARSTVMVKF